MSRERSSGTPFVGLMPYTEKDAPYFFGRERERTLIIANLMASRLTLLYGPSGVGKSSVLRAGVVHQVNQLAARQKSKGGTNRYAIALYSSWSDDPVAGLLKSIYTAVLEASNGEPIKPFDPTLSLVETLQALTRPLPGNPSANLNLLIILDQFEEFFLYPRKPTERSLADELPRALDQADLGVNFLLSLREDHLASLDRFKGHIPYLFDNSLRIKHLSYDAAREAIICPILEYNRLHKDGGRVVSIEPQLVEAVLEQVKTNEVLLGDVGRGIIEVKSEHASEEVQVETPYLQLVMTRLWRQEMKFNSETLRLNTLNKLGGAENIIRKHVDDVMQRLSEEERNSSARVFHYLVTPSGTKIAYLPSDLAALTKLGEQELEEVLNKLTRVDISILTTIDPPPDRPNIPRYEIRHDALAAAILDWRRRFAQKQEEAENDKKLERERQRRVRLSLVLGGVILLLVIMIGLTYFALSARSQALAQQRIALSRELAASSISALDNELGLLLARKAVSTAITVQATDALRRALLRFGSSTVLKGHTDWVNRAVFSPDGKYVLTASGDNTARVWDVESLQSTNLEGHADGLFNASFSPDGKLVATASSDNTARVWDATTGRSIAVLHHEGSVLTARFSPDGERVLTASEDGTARVWEAKTGKQPIELSEPKGDDSEKDMMNDAKYGPDGRLIVTVGWHGKARVWDAQSGQLKFKLQGHELVVHTAAFSPDGKRIATAGQDGTARVWDAETGRELAKLSHGYLQPVFSVVFSSDGNQVLTASKDAKARIWEWQKETGATNPIVLEGHQQAGVGLSEASFSTDGKFVITAGGDGTARIWETKTGHSQGVLNGHSMSIRTASFSPDGRYVVTASTDTTARIWETGTGAEPIKLPDIEDGIDSISYSPDGRFLLIAGDKSHHKRAQVWDSYAREKLADLPGAHGVSFSPDGNYILGIDSNNVVWLWEASTGKYVISPSSAEKMFIAKLSPDGQYVVMGRSDGTAWVWEANTRQVIVELKGHRFIIRSVAFSPDSQYVVTGSADNTARVSEIKTGQVISVLRGHSETINMVNVSRDGKYVLTASDDGTARVWETKTEKNVSVMEGHSAPVLSAAFSSDSQYVVTASADGTARVWETMSGRNVAILQVLDGIVRSAAFSPDGKLIVTAGVDHLPRVWEWQTEVGRTTPVGLNGHTGIVNAAIFSPDGRVIVTGSKDGTVLIHPWEMFAPVTELLKRSDQRVTRELSPQEIKRYLHE